MRKFEAFTCLVPLMILLGGCASGVQRTSVMASPEYAARPAVVGSLFPSDQAVLSDEAIERILSSKLELPSHAKVGLIKFPGPEGWPSRYRWTDEAFVKLEQDYVDTLSGSLLQSERIQEVVPLPSLLTPQTPSIPVLREAAVRMQADLLLIFRIWSDTYSKYRTFAKDKVKAYSTCEMVLLDVRTGLVPFTRIVTQERLLEKQSEDFDLSETMRRAERESALESLRVGANDLVRFIKEVPRKGG
jgi:hypothetical protein